jgi:hypothetical protein
LKTISREYFSQLFYDDGYGFDENKSIVQDIDIRNKHITVSFGFNIPQIIEKIRFDPLNATCIIRVNEVYGIVNGKKIMLEIDGSNADIYFNNTYYFSVWDTQIYIKKNKNIFDEIVFDLIYENFDDDEVVSVIQRLKDLKSAHDKGLEKEHANEIINKEHTINELAEQLNHYIQKYQDIETSFSWKITGPFRSIKHFIHRGSKEKLEWK